MFLILPTSPKKPIKPRNPSASNSHHPPSEFLSQRPIVPRNPAPPSNSAAFLSQRTLSYRAGLPAELAPGFRFMRFWKKASSPALSVALGGVSPGGGGVVGVGDMYSWRSYVQSVSMKVLTLKGIARPAWRDRGELLTFIRCNMSSASTWMPPMLNCTGPI